MSGDPPSSSDDIRSRGARPQPSRLALSLYVLGIAGIGGVAIGFSYLAFASGFVVNADTIVTDPSGAVQEQTLGLFAFFGIFVSTGALFSLLVITGSRYLDTAETADNDRV